MNILFGIISGLLVGFITVGSSLVYQRIILPWYLEVVYDGYNVEGTWRIVTTEPDIRRDITFRLYQKAGVVTGVSTHVLKDKNAEGDYIKKYELEGELNERFLSLRTRALDRKRIGVGTVMIEIVGDGQKMKGYTTSYSSGSSSIVSIKCTAVKVDE